MDAWVEDTVDPTERELMMAHIGLCESCARQLKAYESYAPAMSAAIPPPAVQATSLDDRLRAFFRTPGFAMIAAAGLVLAAVLTPLAIRRTASPDYKKSPASLRPQALGDLPAGSDATLLYPVSEAIEERQPILEWQAWGDQSKVFVFDSARKEVAHSSSLAGSHWLVPVPLDRGAVYSWEVRAAVETGGAGTRQATFRVLSESDAQRLAEARASDAGPMAIGEIAQEMGALAEAQRQFQARVEQNPGDTEAASRRDQVKRLRGR